ncbi:MAG: ABC transporter ATP-binding protein [Candidatus Hydrogenedentes bacterium]|jgi:ABC-2 type transport system ATP-binding protein|nr:ABC transporter ATP-binding protein [Candidatus Hydrogenedentota bacterium]
MSEEYRVQVERVRKVFYTHHFFQRHEETDERHAFRKKAVTAAAEVDFCIRRGEIFGLLGPNGAGKTTTVKMISGLIRPNAGTVYVDGLNVEKKRLQALRKVGVVLEGTRTTIWPLTPLENLAYFGTLKDVRGEVLRSRSLELLDFIGLRDKMNVQVRKLSRGQKQKLAICIALIADPPVVLLDEPTTGLDVQSSRTIKDKIIELTRERGKSALVTTHDMHVAQELCDRIGIINEGRMVACRPTDELIEVFSDFTFVFHLDRLPLTAPFEALRGVDLAEASMEDNEPALVLTISADAGERSEALYGAVEELRAGGYQVRSITQRKQNLENVFLRLTAKQPEKKGAAT